ncbi:Uncharacterised protein [Mycobacteroides abscessus]|nr:Uncharacterised protein [Mycobacteroides abscessus]
MALPKPLTTLVRLRTAPPLEANAAELSTDSTVAAAVVESRPIVSPSASNGPSAEAPTGGRIDTKTSPSGVAERNSAVLPLGSRTPSRIRSVVTAVKLRTCISSTCPTSAPANFTFALSGRFRTFEKSAVRR